jgi:hypothetical protein
MGSRTDCGRAYLRREMHSPSLRTEKPTPFLRWENGKEYPRLENGRAFLQTDFQKLCLPRGFLKQFLLMESGMECLGKDFRYLYPD